MASAPFVHQFELGPWNNFLYFVGDRAKRAVAVVDPAWDAATILREAEKEDVEITHILCSHSHFDHVDQVGALLDKIDVPVYMLQKEIDFSGFRSENLIGAAPGDRIVIGSCEITMVHTPGHTPGSVSYRIDGGLITGDTLFVNGCGRCDFVGGEPETMYRTLHMLTDTFDPATRIYPGHHYGPTASATLGEQKESNPYVKAPTLADFLRHRMEGKQPNTPLPPKPTDWVPPVAV